MTYCLECGTELPAEAHFCSQCGALVVVADALGIQDAEQVAAGHQQHQQLQHKPLIVVRPRLVAWIVFARYLPLQINLTVSGAIIFGLIAVLYHTFTGTLEHPFRPFIFFGAFFFISVPSLMYLAYYKTIEATRYEFYRDRIEYYDGFWTVKHRVLYYKHIAEITLRRGLVQRLYGLGSLHFSVPTMGPKYPGMLISDIEQPETLYEQIDKLVRSY